MTIEKVLSTMNGEAFCQSVIQAAKLDKYNLFESFVSIFCPDSEADNIYWFDTIDNILSDLDNIELTNRRIQYSNRKIIKFTHLTHEQFYRIYDALGW